MPNIAPPQAPLSPLLRRYLDELAAIRRDADALTAGISDAQFAWRPEPDRWSIGQIVSHLRATGGSYVASLRPALATARERGMTDRGDFRPGLIGGMMVRSMEPPPRMRFKAPRIWRPAEGEGSRLDRERELAGWRALHDDFEALIRAAVGLDLRRVRIASPAAKLMRISAGDALALLLAHERRHLWQMRGVREHAGFPAG